MTAGLDCGMTADCLADPVTPGTRRWGGEAHRSRLGNILASPVSQTFAAAVLGTTAVAVAVLRGPVEAAAVLAVPALVVPLLLSHRDAVSLLTLFVFALFAVPVSYRLGPAGALAVPIGVGCLACWLRHRAAPRTRLDPAFQPVRAATLVLLWLFTLSFAVTFNRITTPLEIGSAERYLVIATAQSGVTLVAADMIGNRARLDTILRRIVLGATFMAVIGGIQFLADRDYSSLLVPPGMSVGSSHREVIELRSDFRRVAGTADHPIEFGVVLAMVLPLALHYACVTRGRAARVWAWAQVAVIGAAIPTSISRSAVLSFAIGITTFLTVRGRRGILHGLPVLALFIFILHEMFPGLLEEIVSLFLGAGKDPSVAGRTEDYAAVWELILQRPFLGLGIGTFTPQQYFFLDNQLLGSVLETGILGTVVLLGWLAVGLSVSRGARNRARAARDRELGQALVASILAGFASFFTFDALGFAIFSGLLFLLVGCAGALWRMTASPEVLAPSPHMLAAMGRS